MLTLHVPFHNYMKKFLNTIYVSRLQAQTEVTVFLNPWQCCMKKMYIYTEKVAHNVNHQGQQT